MGVPLAAVEESNLLQEQSRGKEEEEHDEEETERTDHPLTTSTSTTEKNLKEDANRNKLTTANEEYGAYNEEPIKANDEQVYGMYYQVICYAHTLCSSYEIICLHCTCDGHFLFQCSHTYYDESLASFYSNDANREVIEYVLYKGA